MASNHAQVIPAPGLAIFPQYIADHPITLTLKGQTFSKDMTVNTPDGTTIFNVTGETFSMSHRRTVYDARSHTPLFQVRKDGAGTRSYHAETVPGEELLFQCETETHFLHKSQIVITFANQADGNRPVVELRLTPPSMGDDGMLLWNEQKIAVIDKQSMRISGTYELQIAPGLDPSLVVGIVVMMIDRARTRASNNSSAGASASAAGGF